MGPCSVFLSLPSFHTCWELVANRISHLTILMMRACVIFLAFVAVALAEVYLDERFADGDAWEKRWIQSTNKGETAGKFVLTHGKFYGDAEKDLGIQTSEDARFYGLSTKFQAFSNRDSTVVVAMSSFLTATLHRKICMEILLTSSCLALTFVDPQAKRSMLSSTTKDRTI